MSTLLRVAAAAVLLAALSGPALAQPGTKVIPEPLPMGVPYYYQPGNNYWYAPAVPEPVSTIAVRSRVEYCRSGASGVVTKAVEESGYSSWMVTSFTSSNRRLPLGAEIVTSSPSSLPSRPRPIGEAVEINPCSTSASSGITSW